MALVGKVVIEGNNTAGRNLIGASEAGGDHDGNDGASAQHLSPADRYDKLNESLNDPDLFPTQASIPDDVPAPNEIDIDNSGPALGSGEIAGLVIAAVIVMLLIVMGTAYFCWKKNCFRQMNRPGPQAIPNVMEMQSTR